MRSLRLLVVALLALALVAVPAIGQGTPRPVKKLPGKGVVKVKAGKGKTRKLIVGIADQNPATFADRRFQRLNLRYARRSIAWDMFKHEWQIAEVDAWLQAARAQRIRPVITFARSRTRIHKVPTRRQVRSTFKQFRKRWPWVREFVASNESNHGGEPTFKKPKLAAGFYNDMRKACKRCKIAAATLVEQNNTSAYVRRFMKYAKRRPKYWALHNWVSANRRSTKRTKQFLEATKRGEVWLTETGGMVKRRKTRGKGVLRMPQGKKHAAKATTFIFRRLVTTSPRIKRVYLYHWKSGGRGVNWDSGLIDARDKRRPAFKVLERILKRRRA